MVVPSTPTSPASAPSAWAPLRERVFAVLWLANLISSIGGWMFNVGAGWLMTTLNPSPFMVSLVQTANLLPVFLFALPAGAMGDVFDRRRLLVIMQWLLVAVNALFTVLVWRQGVTPAILLVFTFLVGVGSALMSPAWQAIVPQLVSRENLQSGIALNSVGMNVARAIGPALGGFLITVLGLTWPFLLNTLSFFAVIAALLWWRPPTGPARPLPAEHLLAAMKTGLHYARESPALKSTLWRALGFFPFSSAYWALLPLIAREHLHGGPGLYGILLGAIGAGAVGGALVLPAMKRRLGIERLVILGSLMTAASLVLFGLVPRVPVALAASLMAGAAWIFMLSSFNVSAQLALPEWVRARGLAVFQMVFFGAMAAGSLLWGRVAGEYGLAVALLAAGIGLALASALTFRARLNLGEALDLRPSGHWEEPVVAAEHDRGPVMVSITYQVAEPAWEEFLARMDALGASRRRDGAFSWGVYQDGAQSERFREVFFIGSWLEHLRQHERVTETEHQLQDAIRALLVSGTAPEVEHWLAGDPHLHEPAPDAAHRDA